MADEMKSHVKVAVIGGGVVGASVLYHLTKGGWKDVVLLERDELTSGSTWHAAGGFHTLNGDPNVAKLQDYTINLYKEIEDISGQDCGVHLTGGVALADTPERLEWLKSNHAKGKYLGMHTEMISVNEARDLFPLLDEKHVAGAMYDPIEGHLDPYGVTHAYAKSAKKGGAEIYLKTKVEELVQREDAIWEVVTNKGTIHAEHVVNAGGLWAREVGRMVGLELPLLAMEHQYLLTEDMPEVKEINETTGKEVLHAIDFGSEIYMRQERGGMLMGTYERAGQPWMPKETSWDFGHELLQSDLDRIALSLEVGFEHFPAFQNAGIKQIINGPFTFAPDGNPLIGPVRGLKNYWCACAVMAGFSQGGGVGVALANWMIDGDPGFDVFGMDVARFGSWANLAYTNGKVRENYSRRFRIRFPNEELPACRPLHTTPIYDKMKAMGAIFGDSWGLETPLWFSKDGAEEVFSFHRSTDFETVKEEVKAVRGSVGIMEISNFAKYEITGSGAEVWLSRIMANRIPNKGRTVLSPMLNYNGKLIADFSVTKADDDRFYIFGSGVGQEYHLRWFHDHLPGDGSVTVRALGLDLCGLSIAGPNARKVLAKVTDEDVSHDAFKFMAFKEIDLGMIPVMIGRITFTGDLGYEIWVKPEFQRTLFDNLLEAGEEFGIRPFGSRALNAMRLEKNWGTWAREYRPIYGVYEAGMGRFVNLSKNDFIGRDAAMKEKEDGPERSFVSLVVDGGDADVIGDEPVYHNGEMVGWVTSGGFAHNIELSVAQGYIQTEFANGEANGSFEIEILGEKYPAKLQLEPLFDAESMRMHS